MTAWLLRHRSDGLFYCISNHKHCDQDRQFCIQFYFYFDWSVRFLYNIVLAAADVNYSIVTYQL